MEPQEYLERTSEETLAAHRRFVKDYGSKLVEAARILGQCVRSGGKILIMGNGGSAADAQHMAAEMVGRMLIDRRPLAAIALTTDSSNLTALSNDFSFEEVFSKQVQALARKGDVVIAISTSGKSKNVLRAVDEAKRIGCQVIGLSGGDGGKLVEKADVALNVAGGSNSSRIQESHIFAVHSLVDLLDRFFLEEGAR